MNTAPTARVRLCLQKVLTTPGQSAAIYTIEARARTTVPGQVLKVVSLRKEKIGEKTVWLCLGSHGLPTPVPHNCYPKFSESTKTPLHVDNTAPGNK